MSWKVSLKDSAVEDLRFFGRKQGRLILNTASESLAEDPLVESKNMKSLRKNAFAQREFRLLGKYRVLFNVNEQDQVVTILAVGEKRGNVLLVQGEEFKAHHESNSVE